jgi:hypothetical protein
MADASGAASAALMSSPYGALLGGIGQGVGKGLGSAMSDTGSTTSATSSVATYGTQHGGTGWVINFGSGDVSSEATNKQTSTNPSSPGQAAQALGLGGGEGASPALIAAGLVIAALAYRMLRKGRH